MEQYNNILREIADKETMLSVILIIILMVILVLIWGLLYHRCVRMKKRNGVYTLKQIKLRRSYLTASIALSCICVVLGGLIIADSAVMACDINKDIEQGSYVTHTGGYRIKKDAYLSRKLLYDRWLSVEFDSGDMVSIYTDNVSEALRTQYGEFNGTIVYGKNSLIVVDITSN